MKMPFAKLGSAAAALALAVSAQSSFAQNFYKWVDAKGSTHYTAAPPPKSAKKKGQVETYGWKNAAAPAPAAGSQAQPEAKAAAQEAQQAAAMATAGLAVLKANQGALQRLLDGVQRLLPR